MRHSGQDRKFGAALIFLLRASATNRRRCRSVLLQENWLAACAPGAPRKQIALLPIGLAGQAGRATQRTPSGLLCGVLAEQLADGLKGELLEFCR